MEGSAVMTICGGWLCPPNAVWDTLLWLGVPGDRWMGDDVDPDCYPLGVVEIQDTGHVIIQGLSLRTWDIARLDQNGDPIPETALGNFGDTLGIIERVRWNLSPPPQPCGGGIVVDYFWFTRTHYSDVDISLPEGSTCDIITSTNQPEGDLPFAIGPNPGTDQVTITGLSTGTMIRVCDPLGRLIHSTVSFARDAIIPTSAWEVGTYYITVSGSDGPQRSVRWVKE